MVKIRLARGGVNKKPFYTIVVTDSRKSRDSGYIQRIGYFNPVAKGKEARLNLDMEKLSIWIEKGAKLTERVQTLVKEWHAPDLYQNKRDKKIERVNKKRAQKRAEKLDTNQVETQVKAEKPKEKVKAKRKTKRRN